MSWNLSFSKKDAMPTFLRQCLDINVQHSTVFSTNGCRVDTNDKLSYFSYFKYFLTLQIKSAAAQFKVVLIKSTVCASIKNLHTERHVKPHSYCFCII